MFTIFGVSIVLCFIRKDRFSDSLTFVVQYHLILFKFFLPSEKMEVELQGQDLKSVIEMEDSLLKQKGEVCLFQQTRRIYVIHF